MQGRFFDQSGKRSLFSAVRCCTQSFLVWWEPSNNMRPPRPPARTPIEIEEILVGLEAGNMSIMANTPATPVLYIEDDEIRSGESPAARG